MNTCSCRGSRFDYHLPRLLQHSSPYRDQYTNVILDLRVPTQVCDSRCGTGLYGDFNCDWLGLGLTCRRCFEETSVAQFADSIAKTRGQRVILCATHEPPLSAVSLKSHIEEKLGHGGGGGGDANASTTFPQESGRSDHSTAVYVGSTTINQMCVFLRGYFDLLAEVRLSVSSVLEFMPGMHVAVATHPRDFQVFNR